MNNNQYILGPRGWEKNNYLDDINWILGDFNLQLEKLNQLSNEKLNLTRLYDSERYTVSEEKLRNDYNQDNIKMSFEKYKELILEDIEQKKLDLKKSLARNKDEYNANISYMRDIIYDTSRNIIIEQKKIKRKIEEFKLQLNKLRLDREIKQDLERNHDDKFFEEYRKEESILSFEIQKLQQTLNKTDEMYNLMKQSLIKYSLGLRTLNPREKEYYEAIKIKTNLNYKKQLVEYNELLEMYEDDYERFIDFNNKLLNDEIKYEEYKKYADYMLERYNSLNKQYNELSKLYQKTKEDFKFNQKWHPMLSSEQIDELKNKGIKKPYGAEYENYLSQNGIDNNSIPAPKAPSQVSFLGEKKKDGVMKIEKKQSKPELTWKTAAAVAAGIGIGATVFFTAGPLGVTVMNIAAALAKVVVSKKRAKAKVNRLNGIKAVEKLEIPSGKLKAKIFKLKQYLKSEEGLRDMSWLLTSAILTGTSLTIIDGISNALESLKPESTPNMEPTTNIEPTAPEITTPTETVQVVESPQSIGIGDGIEGMNITEGYDTANWAINNTNAENLLTQYGDGATIKEFVTSAGEHFTSGTLEDIMTKTGLDASDIAARLVTKSGGEYAWVGADQLGAVAKTVGKVL